MVLSPYKGGNSVHGTGTSLNLFANGTAEASQFRPPLVGMDNQTGGAGILRGLPTWNLDMSVVKEFRVTERVNTKFIATFTNVLNHNQLNNPSVANLNISSPSTFGSISGQANNPRQMEFGIRICF